MAKKTEKDKKLQEVILYIAPYILTLIIYCILVWIFTYCSSNKTWKEDPWMLILLLIPAILLLLFSISVIPESSSNSKSGKIMSYFQIFSKTSPESLPLWSLGLLLLIIIYILFYNAKEYTQISISALILSFIICALALYLTYHISTKKSQLFPFSGFMFIFTLFYCEAILLTFSIGAHDMNLRTNPQNQKFQSALYIDSFYPSLKNDKESNEKKNNEQNKQPEEISQQLATKIKPLELGFRFDRGSAKITIENNPPLRSDSIGANNFRALKKFDSFIEELKSHEGEIAYKNGCHRLCKLSTFNKGKKHIY